MINSKSLEAIQSRSFSSHFRKPLYGSYSFDRLPATVANLLGCSALGEGLPKDCLQEGSYDNVILLFIDGFGFHAFERFLKEEKTLQLFAEEGIVSSISSLFPSTTAAHVSFVHTNVLPIQSGIYEWFYYEPLVDAIIAPLLFSYGGDHKVGTLAKAGIKPEMIFPFPTIYPILSAAGISSHIILNKEIALSSYSAAMNLGADSLGVGSLEQGLKKCVELVTTSSKNYCHLYWADIDSAGHRRGLSSPEYAAAVHKTYSDIWQHLILPLKNASTNTALLLVADHGMTSVSPKKTLYLNKELPDLASFIQKTKSGALKAPAGSCRDLFLHIQEEHLPQVKAQIAECVKGIAEVFEVKDLIEQGFFKEKIASQRFLDRVGNLVVLPYKNEAVFWFEKHRFEQHFFAAHGGITPEELDTLFGFLSL